MSVTVRLHRILNYNSVQENSCSKFFTVINLIGLISKGNYAMNLQRLSHAGAEDCL